MAIIKCKMCGGDINLSVDKTFGTCEYCGSVMTFPKVDSDQRAAAFNRGNHFRRIGEFDKALAVYERIVAEDDSDAEAHWCCALCRYGIEYVEDPATYEWLPTCHRASFDSFLEDVDYLAALELSDGVTRRQYQKDAAKIAEVQRGILATSQNTEPYDVFISYKELDDKGNRTRDSILAQDIYYQLTEKGWRVFFSRISLEDVPGTQYEPYIFAALNSAKVMVAVGTSGENLNAVWVKNEWSRFLSLMRKDRSKLLLPCYRDMDPYDLPEQLSVLMSYDMGKIGFIQDLIRGIDKVLSADRPKEVEHETVKETVVVQQGGANVQALIDRGNMALEDRKWKEAEGFFNRALDMNAKCAEAYLGMFLAQRESRDAESFVAELMSHYEHCEYDKFSCPADNARINQAVKTYLVPCYLDEGSIRKAMEFDTGYKSCLNSIKTHLEDARKFFANDSNFARATKFASGESLQKVKNIENAVILELQSRIEKAKAEEESSRAAKAAAYAAHLDKVEETLKLRCEKALAQREEDYAAACAFMDEATTWEQYTDAMDRFSEPKLRDYKDSARLRLSCKNKADEILKQRLATEEAEKAERARMAAEEAERKRAAGDIRKKEKQAKTKRLAIIVGIVAAIAVAAFAVGPLVFDSQLANDKQESQPSIIKISAGGSYTLGLKSDGTVVATGANYSGQCNVSDWTDIVAVSAGTTHTVGLKKDGTVVAVGSNSLGQCNVSGWHKIKAISAGASTTIGLNENGTVVATGANYSGQCNVSDWTDIVGVSAGTCHTVGLYSDGTVVAVGDRNLGKCNVSGWSDIVAISAGSSHTVGLKADGTVVAVGDHNLGKCNVSGWSDIVAISAGSSHTVGLKADGTAVAVGKNDAGQCDVSDWSDIVAISAGSSHTVGLKADGTAVAVGAYAGNLDAKMVLTMSDGSEEQIAVTQNKPEVKVDAKTRQAMIARNAATISAGDYHTVALRYNGTVVAEGVNSSGQSNVSDWTDIVSVSAGTSHTVGLYSDGTVVAVGDDNFGKCNVSHWTDIVAVSAGGYHTAGLKADGTVVAVGSNGSGQCAVSDWSGIVAVSAGSSHTVGLKADGTVAAVGKNDNGQCDVSGWTDIVAVSAGSSHTVGLKADGTVVAVGNNGYGKCDVSGWSDIVAISASMQNTFGLKSDGTVVVVGQGNGGKTNVSAWSDIVAISAGALHAVGLRSDGSLVAVGGYAVNGTMPCNVSGWSYIKLPEA